MELQACDFVSYGGVSSGLHSTQVAQQLVTTLEMMPIVEGVMIQMTWDRVDDNQDFRCCKKAIKRISDLSYVLWCALGWARCRDANCGVNRAFISFR
jgi:hypothetical protein